MAAYKNQEPRRPKAVWPEITKELKQSILNHFWGQLDNRTATISKRFNIPRQQAEKIITKSVKEHFNNIEKRVNGGI